ncbi:hypothetical protein RCT13_09635 [Escherichia marmotae]|nr:hypothetical protein [Escherichia marmotae]MEC9945025.1 hypothetical protein [Escherichia marmotae]MED0172787.1 hypothetical protein [Escherichia marmotae]
MKKILMVGLLMAFYAHGARLDLVPGPGSPLPAPELDYEHPKIFNTWGLTAWGLAGSDPRYYWGSGGWIEYTDYVAADILNDQKVERVKVYPPVCTFYWGTPGDANDVVRIGVYGLGDNLVYPEDSPGEYEVAQSGRHKVTFRLITPLPTTVNMDGTTRIDCTLRGEVINATGRETRERDVYWKWETKNDVSYFRAWPTTQSVTANSKGEFSSFVNLETDRLRARIDIESNWPLMLNRNGITDTNWYINQDYTSERTTAVYYIPIEGTVTKPGTTIVNLRITRTTV